MGDDIVLTLNSIAKINSIKNNSIKLHYIFKMKKIDSRYLGFNPMLSGGGAAIFYTLFEISIIEYHVT